MAQDDEVRVPIKIDGGIELSVDPFVLPPGKLLQAENMRSDKTGALRSRPGSTQLRAASSTNPPIVVGGERTCLLMSDDSTDVVSATGENPAVFGGPAPLSVELERIIGGRGYIPFVQVCRTANYTAVAYVSIADHYNKITNNVIEDTGRLTAIILDDDYRVVWGPHTVVKGVGSTLPRIEAL